MTDASPITNDRLKAALDQLETKYRTDDDGEFIGWWGDNLVIGFHVVGSQDDILQIWGGWSARPPAGLRPRFLELCNTWNADKRWPKVYVVSDDDTIRIRGEHNIDCEGDVTGTWLVQQVKCAVGTMCQFFDDLEESYPEHVAWLPEG